jgi:hypothetical protein
MKKHRIACREKIQHSSRQNAIIALIKLKKREGVIAFPYKCRRCSMWHIGKPSARENPIIFWENIQIKLDKQKSKG